MPGKAQDSYHLTEGVCDVGYVVQGVGEIYTVPRFTACAVLECCAGSRRLSGRRRLPESLREPPQHPSADHAANQEHSGKHTRGMI